MKTSNNTILITGGSAGIGLATAKAFLAKGNEVIITGRDAKRLEQAAAQLPGVHTIVSDVSSETAVDELVQTIRTKFPQLNVLINNAGYAVAYTITPGQETWKEAEKEMYTNYVSVVRLTEKLLPVLQQQAAAAVVNVTSIVAYAPGLHIPTYSASKAALNSYSKILRLSLKDTSIKVFELMPPLVNTDFSAGIGGANGIAPEVVANDLLNSMEQDVYNIHTGKTADIYELLKVSPTAALNAMNGVTA
ncbi:MAG TPA: SDR family NAD(P)-dependent oxidoreductase [Chitinophaga sp.]|uniref:SDR family oxidoreductase n=1 Tax=Chitinophaga sp. TaxID=1869181 RepID=UPI002F93CF99